MEKNFNKKVKEGGGEGEDDYENDKDDGRHLTIKLGKGASILKKQTKI